MYVFDQNLYKLKNFINNIMINIELAERNGEEISYEKVSRYISLMNKVYLLLYNEEKTKKYIVIFFY